MNAIRPAKETDDTRWYIPDEMSIDDVAALAHIYSFGLELAENNPNLKAWISSGWTATRQDGGILIKRESFPQTEICGIPIINARFCPFCGFGPILGLRIHWCKEG